jgi:hypothetical protein
VSVSGFSLMDKQKNLMSMVRLVRIGSLVLLLAVTGCTTTTQFTPLHGQTPEQRTTDFKACEGSATVAAPLSWWYCVVPVPVFGVWPCGGAIGDRILPDSARRSQADIYACMESKGYQGTRCSNWDHAGLNPVGLNNHICRQAPDGVPRISHPSGERQLQAKEQESLDRGFVAHYTPWPLSAPTKPV